MGRGLPNTVTAVAPETGRFAFKAREIEELADVYFFRPFGMVFARAAHGVGLSATTVTFIGTAVGVAGGALLARPESAFAGFLVLVLHGVLDSSDGQLARMTNTSSDFGRMMDGIGGYVTHTAIYLGILASALVRGSGWNVGWLCGLAAAANVVHAQMYDYHRNAWVSIVAKGEPTRPVFDSLRSGVVGVYESMQRALAGLHPTVEALIATRQQDGHVIEEDRQRYRRCFYWPVRGWNLLGDNTRFYAIGVCAWLGRVDWFFAFVLLPMNVAFVALWIWQSRADRRFLAGV
jgi:phosphatidylglycerophosphate synthase